LLSLALCLSLIFSVPGAVALSADCCRVETEVSAAGALANQGSDASAAAHHHGFETKTFAGADSRPGPGHEPSVDRGLPFSNSHRPSSGSSDAPGHSLPVCGLSACLELPQASLALQASLGHQLSPETVVAMERGRTESRGFLKSIFRPPRA
jgi:hypothetical protein